MFEDSLKVRQVTKFVSCADKVASFWKLKHSVKAVFGQTSCISLPLALASLVSLANGKCVDLLIVCLSEVKIRSLLFFCRQVNVVIFR